MLRAGVKDVSPISAAGPLCATEPQSPRGAITPLRHLDELIEPAVEVR